MPVASARPDQNPKEMASQSGPEGPWPTGARVVVVLVVVVLVLVVAVVVGPAVVVEVVLVDTDEVKPRALIEKRLCYSGGAS